MNTLHGAVEIASSTLQLALFAGIAGEYILPTQQGHLGGGASGIIAHGGLRCRLGGLMRYHRWNRRIHSAVYYKRALRGWSTQYCRRESSTPFRYLFQ